MSDPKFQHWAAARQQKFQTAPRMVLLEPQKLSSERELHRCFMITVHIGQGNRQQKIQKHENSGRLIGISVSRPGWFRIRSALAGWNPFSL